MLLDEFGKGTATADGAGLLSAALETLAASGPPPPLLLACSHFSELASQPELLPPPSILARATMQVLVDGRQCSSAATLTNDNVSDSSCRPAAVTDASAAVASAAALGSAASGAHHVFLYRLVPGCVDASYGVCV